MLLECARRLLVFGRLSNICTQLRITKGNKSEQQWVGVLHQRQRICTEREIFKGEIPPKTRKTRALNGFYCDYYKGPKAGILGCRTQPTEECKCVNY